MSSLDESHARQLCPDSACIGVLRADLSCPECGAVASAADAAADRDADATHRSEDPAVDLRYRSLCPDGTCIGLLGADGRCKECGRVGAEVTTDPRLRGLKEVAAEDRDPVTPTEAPTTTDFAADSPFFETPPEFTNRRLCPDGTCIGLIGTAGTCNECGIVA